MRGIRNFIQGGWGGGGGGGPGPTAGIFFFYSPELIGGQMVLLQRKLCFSKDPEGVHYFPGGGGLTFSLC